MLENESYVQSTGANPQKLHSSREELETLLASIKSTTDFTIHGFEHPFFGMLSIQQWIDTLSLHERRHLAQIQEMILI
jgi:Protein of unknown function (DUF1569)